MMAGTDMLPYYVVVKGGQKCKRVPAVGAGKLGLVGKLVQSGDCWTGINKWQHWVDMRWSGGGSLRAGEPGAGDPRAGEPGVLLPSEWIWFLLAGSDYSCFQLYLLVDGLICSVFYLHLQAGVYVEFVILQIHKCTGGSPLGWRW